MEQCIVRAAREEDLQQIRRLGARLAEGAAPWRPRAAFERAAQGWLEDSLRAMGPDHPVWVAVDQGGVVGVVSARTQRHFTGQDDCYVGELVVASDAEGRGIGRRLMAAVEVWAAGCNLRRVTLETGAANHRALRFYEDLGYREEQVQLTKLLR